MDSAAPDRAQRVFLHVGLPKTGTTYLQDRLWRNRDAALRQGLLYPGDDVREAHFHAAVHLQPERYLDWVDPLHKGAWERLVQQVQQWPGSSIISHELFASATDEQAADALRALDFAEVHIVCTARDLARQIPSVWQENVKNQHTSTFTEFVTAIRDPSGPHDPFWEFQDLTRILRTWARDVPPHRVHVVTVPAAGSGPDELWQRFTSVLGVAPGSLSRDVPSGNNALDAAQIEVLRRINERVRGRIEWARYESVVKGYLIGEVLFASTQRRAPSLPPEESGWVAEVAARVCADIRAAGYDIVGDLADLEPRPPSSAPAEPGVDEVLDAAVEALQRIVQTMPEPGSSRSAADRVKNVLRRRRRRVLALARTVSRR